VAHIGYFRDECVRRRGWVGEETFADLVALCQVLPGPSSTQLGIALGILRARVLGGFAFWLGFMLPSAIVLVVFAYVVEVLGGHGDLGWLEGMEVVAVPIVAAAVWDMGRSLTPDRPRLLLALGSTILAVVLPPGWGQVAAIALGGVVGALLFRALGADADRATEDRAAIRVPIRPPIAVAVLITFGCLLVALPVARQLVEWRPLEVFESFFIVASFVFGSGHVVLPLLETATVTSGWVSQQVFLAGFGMTQAVPGPIFAFAAFLGVFAIGGVQGAVVALVAIFAPSFFLLIGVLPFWDALRRRTGFRSVLTGVNAAVVGVLVAALYHPVWTSTVRSTSDFVLVLVGFAIVFVLKAPPWIAVVVLGLLGAAFHGLGLARL